MKPVFPSVTGGFLTTGPSGKYNDSLKNVFHGELSLRNAIRIIFLRVYNEHYYIQGFDKDCNKVPV